MGEEMEYGERYPNEEKLRWIVDISLSGDCVVLDDGSKWHVVPTQRMISGNWPRTLELRVSPVEGLLYTLSAENDLEVQAIYEGFRPIHEEPEVDERSAPAAGTETEATSEKGHIPSSQRSAEPEA